MPAAPSSPPPPPPPPATSLDDIRRTLGDRYAIERELGRGGMGSVYLARDLRLDRLVALKVLPPEFASDSALRERFVRETRTAASFSHPNIVPVHAVEERGELLAYAMGYVEGESLAQRVARAGPLGVKEIVRVLHDVGYALAYAHGRGVVHRDIKPDNIMIERATGRALLMDFGISRTITARPAVTQGLTRVGEVVGTPEYMSPEQASGDVLDGRSDLYSLGLVAFLAATGRPAITGETTQKILVRQLTEAVPSVGALRADFPAALSAAIDRCVAKNPEERFPGAESLVEALDDARLQEPEIPVPVRLLAQELGTLSLIVVFTTIIGVLVARSLRMTQATIDSLIPALFLFAIVLTRFMQSFAWGRRLGAMGFSSAEVMKGLRAVVDEGEALRTQLRADPETRRRRRRTIVMAAVQLVVALLLLRFAMSTRIPVGPGQYLTPLPGVVMALSAIMMVAIAAVLLIRSPFRMPPGERLFRLFWLGPVGRAFVSLAVRGRRTGSPTPTPASFRRLSGAAPEVAPAGSVGTDARAVSARARSDGSREEEGVSEVGASRVPHTSTDRLGELELRVEALERWRNGGQSPT